MTNLKRIKTIIAIVIALLTCSAVFGDAPKKDYCGVTFQNLCEVSQSLTIPKGWKLVGAADFNGDNYPDFILFHEGTGHVYVWYLRPTY